MTDLKSSHNSPDVANSQDTTLPQVSLSSTPEYMTHLMMDQIVYQIVRRMRELEWNQKRLAEEMGVKSSQVSRLLTAAENTSLITIARAAVALDLAFHSIKMIPKSDVDDHVDEFDILINSSSWWSVTKKPRLVSLRSGRRFIDDASTSTTLGSTSQVLSSIPIATSFKDVDIDSADEFREVA